MKKRRNPKAAHRKLRKYPYKPSAHTIVKGVPFVELELPGREETDTPVYIANPLDLPTGRYSSESLFLFQFGAVGASWVAVWGRHLEDALEEVGGFLADHLPGHIMKHDDPYLKELYEEALSEMSYIEGDEDAEAEAQAWDKATEDLTYTESGYLTSYEWHVDELSPNDPLYQKIWRKSADAYRKQYGEMPESPERSKPRRKRKNPSHKTFKAQTSTRQLKSFLSR